MEENSRTKLSSSQSTKSKHSKSKSRSPEKTESKIKSGKSIKGGKTPKSGSKSRSPKRRLTGSQRDRKSANFNESSFNEPPKSTPELEDLSSQGLTVINSKIFQSIIFIFMQKFRRRQK